MGSRGRRVSESTVISVDRGKEMTGLDGKTQGKEAGQNGGSGPAE